MPSNHLILCCPLLLLPSIFPSIRVFSNELALPIRWPECWSLEFNRSLSVSSPVCPLEAVYLTWYWSILRKGFHYLLGEPQNGMSWRRWPTGPTRLIPSITECVGGSLSNWSKSTWEPCFNGTWHLPQERTLQAEPHSRPAECDHVDTTA